VNAPLCPRCEYDLRGTPGGTCPECGCDVAAELDRIDGGRSAGCIITPLAIGAVLWGVGATALSGAVRSYEHRAVLESDYGLALVPAAGLVACSLALTIAYRKRLRRTGAAAYHLMLIAACLQLALVVALWSVATRG